MILVPQPATAPPATLRTSNFADSPAVVIPQEPKLGTLPSVPAPPTSMSPSPTPMTPMPGATASGPSASPTLPNPAPAATSKEDDWTVKFKFKPGDNNLLQMETANGLFKFYAGGRLQIDAAWVRAADNVQAPRADGGTGNLRDGVNFRRARFDFGGTFYKNIDFLMEWDFINTTNVERHGDPLAINTTAQRTV
jgi:phosphate-selective porin OprO/OprP